MSTSTSRATGTTASFEVRVESVEDRLIVRLPAAASSALPSRGQVAVDARVATGAGTDGHPWSTVVEPDGRRGHWLAVDRQLPAGLSLEDGDQVQVELTPTRSWPEPVLPPDLDDALRAAPDLAPTWADLTPMARWEWVRWVGATRNPQTRERRVEVTLSKLRAGSRRPCCFDTAACTDPELSRNGRLVEPSSV